MKGSLPPRVIFASRGPRVIDNRMGAILNALLGIPSMPGALPFLKARMRCCESRGAGTCASKRRSILPRRCGS
eukprot:214174-Pyramimonas_sp.AAC.1